MRCSNETSFEYAWFVKHFRRQLRQHVDCRRSASVIGVDGGDSDDSSGDSLDFYATTYAAAAAAASACLDYNISDDEAPPSSYARVENALYTIVIPLVCLFGIVGNTLNLVVLASMVVHKTMDRMERSATVGLLALAVSDLFFCVTVVPLVAVDEVSPTTLPDRLTLGLLYSVYHAALISTLITCSTWLTVVMAVSRYLAICHPLRARIIIGKRFAAASVFFAFVFSVLLNVPRFLHLAVACVPDDAAYANTGNESMETGANAAGPSTRFLYFSVPGLLQRHGALDQAYYASYLVVGVLLPLVVLAYCNFFLIRAIRQSTRMRNQFRRPVDSGTSVCAGGSTVESVRSSAAAVPRASAAADDQSSSAGRHRDSSPTNPITLTLTVIVIMYAVLVSPAEISNIFTKMINTYIEQHKDTERQQRADDQPRMTLAQMDSYNLAIAVANALQTLNFACNFILYCTVNVHFRLVVRRIVTCRGGWRSASAAAATGCTATVVTTHAAATGFSRASGGSSQAARCPPAYRRGVLAAPACTGNGNCSSKTDRRKTYDMETKYYFDGGRDGDAKSAIQSM